MSTFTCQQLANAWNWGACSCQGNPMPVVGSVSWSSWPPTATSPYWDSYELTGAKMQCCEIACEAYASANPMAELEGVGQNMGNLGVPSKKPPTLQSDKYTKFSGSGKTTDFLLEVGVIVVAIGVWYYFASPILKKIGIKPLSV